VIDQPGQLPTDVQAKVPFEPLPAIVNEVLAPAAHLLCGGPAFATGFAWTVSVTSDVVEPQLALVSVARNVQLPSTLPPLNTMDVVGLFGSVIVQPGQLPTGAQWKVPFEPLAAIVNEVLAPVAHLVCGGPAFTIGFALTVRSTSEVAEPQPEPLADVRRKVQDDATFPPE